MYLRRNERGGLSLRCRSCSYQGFVCMEYDDRVFPGDIFVCGRADGYWTDGVPECEYIDLLMSAEILMNWRVHVKTDSR